MSSTILKSLPRLYLWQMIAVVFGLVTQVYLARVLGPHDKGILDLFLLIPIVLSSITDVGLLSANTFFSGKKTFPLNVLHSNTVVWSCVIVVVLVCSSLLWNFFGGSPFTSLTTEMFFIALLATGPMLYVALWGSLMYGSERAESVYIVQGISTVVQFAFYIAAIVLQVSLFSIILITAGMLLFKACLAAQVYYRRNPPAFTPSAAVLSASMKYGIALFIGIFINILHNRVIQFLVEGYLGPAALGCYAMAARFVEMIWLLDFVIINASLFKITSSSMEDAVRLTMRMTRAIGVIVVGAGLGMAVILPWFIPHVLGDGYSPSVVPALILIPGIVFWSIGRSLSQFIAYQVGKPWYNTSIALIAFVLNIAMALVLLPRWGIIGAAAASLCSYACMAILMTMAFAKLANVPVSSIYRVHRDDVVIMKQLFHQMRSSRT